MRRAGYVFVNLFQIALYILNLKLFMRVWHLCIPSVSTALLRGRATRGLGGTLRVVLSTGASHISGRRPPPAQDRTSQQSRARWKDPSVYNSH